MKHHFVIPAQAGIQALLCFCILGLFLASGCATQEGAQPPVVISIEDEGVQDALIEVAARRAAYLVGRNNPKILDAGIAFCSAFEGQGVDIRPLFVQGIKYLDNEVDLSGDPLLKRDIETLIGLFNVSLVDPDTPLTPRQEAMIRLAARSFKEGFQEAQANPKVTWLELAPWCL